MRMLEYGVDTYSEAKVEKSYAYLESPQETYCCRPACDLNLRTDDPPYVFWVRGREGAPLFI
jgi:hypothetical protein